MKAATRDPPPARFLLMTISTSTVGKKRGASVVYDLDPKHFRTEEVDAAATNAPDLVNRNLTSTDSEAIGSVLVDEYVPTRDLTRMRVSKIATTSFPPSFVPLSTSLPPRFPVSPFPHFLTTAATDHALSAVRWPT